jgi:hypothetical protein
MSGQQVRVRAFNRPKFKDFRKKPAADRSAAGFFVRRRLSPAVRLRGRNMTILNEKEALSREEKFVALAHIYLELHLSLQGAMSAAAADLVHLDGSDLVAEAA